MIHPQVRKAVLDKLKSINPGKIFWYDGRPAFLAPEELPAVAVYLTDAKATGGSIDEEEWEAVLHIEVFLKATATDSELDKCCLLYTSPSPRDRQKSRMPSSA